jgi:hypothetical protein
MRMSENRNRVEERQRDPWIDWVREATRQMQGDEGVIRRDFDETLCRVSRMTGASFDAVKAGLLDLRREALTDRRDKNPV